MTTERRGRQEKCGARMLTWGWIRGGRGDAPEARSALRVSVFWEGSGEERQLQLCHRETVAAYPPPQGIGEQREDTSFIREWGDV